MINYNFQLNYAGEIFPYLGRSLFITIFSDIPIEEVKEKIKNPKTVLIDCRTEEEYEQEGYVRGFVNIPSK